MSFNQEGQKIFRWNTKTFTRNGVTGTIRTEVVQLANGGTKTITKTTTSGSNAGNLSTGNHHHQTNQADYTTSHSKGTGGDITEIVWQWHNYYRAQHGVPNLVLSQSLNNYAQEWANRLASEDSFHHRDNRLYGENLYSQWSSIANFDISGKAPVDNWYSEIKDFTFGVDRPSSLVAGHFTQLIWKDSKSLGVGKAKSRSGKIIVVCNYDPPGNMAGRYASMVPRKH